MKFEIGKCYQHSDGSQMKIVGAAQTVMWGLCLIAEEVGGLITVGSDETNAVNWHEIPESEFMQNYS